MGLSGAGTAGNTPNRSGNLFQNISAEFNRAGGKLDPVTWVDVYLEKPAYVEMKRLEFPPAKNSLPQHIQDFLNDIKDYNDLDKIRAIHDFTLKNIDYIDQSCGDVINFNTIFKSPRIQGDCDDYALYNAVLMHSAGIKEAGFLGGIVKHTFLNGQTNVAGHAVAVAKIDDKIYMLDHNLAEPAEMINGRSIKPVIRSFESGGQKTNNMYNDYISEVRFERLMLYVDYGKDGDSYFWRHQDDHLVYGPSNCPPNNNNTKASVNPDSTQEPAKFQSGGGVVVKP